MNLIRFAGSRCGALKAALAMAALALLGRPAFADPALIGNWRLPIDCADDLESSGWPDGSMHAIHLAVPDGAGSKPRILLWNSVGCPHIPGPPAPGTSCEDSAVPSLAACVPYEPYCDNPFFDEPFSARVWNPLPAPPGPPYPPPAYYDCPTGEDGCQILNDCNGHASLDDGRILIIGGGCGPNNADRDVLIFDPAALGGNPWTQVADMQHKRWYPAALTLGDGRIMAFSGECGLPPDPSGCVSGGTGTWQQESEIYNPHTNTWQIAAPGPDSGTIKSYPYMFLLHDGRILWGGHGPSTGILKLSGPAAPDWHMLPIQPDPNEFNMYEGSAVTYAPGKVLKCGGLSGTDQASATTAVIDCTVAVPTWTEDETDILMQNVRFQHDLVLLPDGHVLAVGGSGDCIDCPEVGTACNREPVMEAEWIDPHALQPTWTPLAEMTIPRGYHSTTLLLPDGTVLASGGADRFYCPPNCNPNNPGQPYPTSRTAQIYEPPYMFYGPRPVITAAPQRIPYDGTFAIGTSLPSGQSIVKVSLVRLAAVTHGFDQNQRFIELEIIPECTTSSAVHVHGPLDGNHAPPGHYMLFVNSANADGSNPTQLRPCRLAKYVMVGPRIGDINGDCKTDGVDLALLLGAWEEVQENPCLTTAEEDLNRDCKVDGFDLAMLLANWDDEGEEGCVTTSGCGGAGPMGGGEAAAGGPAQPDCGGGIDLFQHWLDTGDMDAFWQWLNCTLGLGGGGGSTQ